MPRRVWVAIGPSDWSPVPAYPPTRIVRFTEKYLRQGTEHHKIAGVDVPIYSAAKTLADLFRNGRLGARSIAVEGPRAAIEQRPTKPGQTAEAARSRSEGRITLGARESDGFGTRRKNSVGHGGGIGRTTECSWD